MIQPDTPTLRASVIARYNGLAETCCTLSCGAALDLAAPTSGETLVDLGCGRGADVIRAAGRVGAGGRAIGVDLNEEMLARARAATPPALDNVGFVRGDLAAFALPDSSADVVISNCTVNHAPDKAAVYREIHRVLRPGGRFVVSDVVAERPLPEAVRGDAAAWAACYGGAVTLEENLAAMRAAGFDTVNVIERTEPYDKGGVSVLSVTFAGRRGAQVVNHNPKEERP
jgi:SAM-dependent methyltransferase